MEREVRWPETAACVQEDPELFFPPGYSGSHMAVVGEAKRVCVACLAQVECLDFALTTNQDEGVWGGLTPDERQRVQRRHRRQHLGAPV